MKISQIFKKLPHYLYITKILFIYFYISLSKFVYMRNIIKNKLKKFKKMLKN